MNERSQNTLLTICATGLIVMGIFLVIQQQNLNHLQNQLGQLVLAKPPSTQQEAPPPTSVPVPVPASGSTAVTASTSTIIHVLTSNVTDAEARRTGGYCNGDNMDTHGYQARFTIETPITVPVGQTLAQRVTSIILATTGATNILQETPVTADPNGTIHLPTFDGWAGVSIAQCAWSAALRANLTPQRVPGLKGVDWGSFTY